MIRPYPVPRIYAWLALICGLFITGSLTLKARHDITARTQERFEVSCDEVLLHIRAELDEHRQVLLGGAALFNASHEVDRSEWKAYVGKLRLDDHFNGIQGMGFSLWIPQGQLDEHTSAIRREGFPEYRVWPQAAREGYSSIIYLEPFEGRNLRAFGYDMYSEPVRQRAMARARDENQVSLSGRVTLVQETNTDVQAGTLMYAPIYRHNAALETVAQRRAALIGWVYSPFRMNDLLFDTLEANKTHNANDLRLQIFDGHDIDASHLLYSSDDATIHPLTPQMIRQQLTFGGQEWTLLFEMTNEKAFGLDYDQTQWGMLGGIISSILLFLLVGSYGRTRNALYAAEAAAAELRKSEENLRVLARNESVMIWVSGTDKKCTHFNQVWLDFTDRTLEQEIGDGWAAGIHPNDLEQCLSTYNAAFDARREFIMEYRLRHHSGEYRWIIDRGVPRFDDDGEFTGYIGSCVDITERRHSEQTMRFSQFAMDNAFEEIFWLDEHGHIRYINHKACTTLGYSREELLKLSIPDLDPLYPVDQWKKHWQALKQDKSQFFETQHRRKDGSIIPVEVSANYVEFGDLEYNVAFCRDITKRKQAEEEIRTLAFYDPLTHLPNRRMMQERLAQALATSKRNGESGALIFFDLDNFKPLNDTYGHEVGDKLLIEVARRITGILREVDTVSRFGGDEFVIILGDMSADPQALKTHTEVVAEKIRAALSEPYRLSRLLSIDEDTQQIITHHCTASIGITLFDGRTDTPAEVLKRGDVCMYKAKEAGRNRSYFCQ